LTRKHGQKTVSLRLTDPALVPLYRQQIQALRQFETVVDGLVRVGEQLSDLAVAEVVQEKTPGGTGTSRRGASSRRRPGRPPRRGRSPGDFAASLAATRSPGGDPLPLWPAHAQSRAARQRVVNDLGPGALRALPLSMRPLFPGALSRRRAFGHRPDHLFARRAPTHGACG
jgi:hypothetical protein